MSHRRFCGGPQSYSKNCLLSSKSFSLVISIGELTKIGNFDALTFSRRSRQKSLSQRRRPFFLEIRAITEQTTLTRLWRHYFSRRKATELWFNSGGPQSNEPCKLSKHTKWSTVPKRLRITALNVI